MQLPQTRPELIQAFAVLGGYVPKTVQQDDYEATRAEVTAKGWVRPMVFFTVDWDGSFYGAAAKEPTG